LQLAERGIKPIAQHALRKVVKRLSSAEGREKLIQGASHVAGMFAPVAGKLVPRFQRYLGTLSKVNRGLKRFF
jgi:hypothetical protein